MMRVCFVLIACNVILLATAAGLMWGGYPRIHAARAPFSVVDSYGRPIVTIESGHFGDPVESPFGTGSRLSMFDASGRPLIQIIAGNQMPAFRLKGPRGEDAIVLEAYPNGSTVNMSDARGRAHVRMTASEDAGQVFMWCAGGSPTTNLTGGPHGGFLQVNSTDGRTNVSLSAGPPSELWTFSRGREHIVPLTKLAR